jgi:hypothetical protein
MLSLERPTRHAVSHRFLTGELCVAGLLTTAAGSADLGEEVGEPHGVQTGRQTSDVRVRSCSRATGRVEYVRRAMRAAAALRMMGVDGWLQVLT